MDKPDLPIIKSALERLGCRIFDGVNRSRAKKNYDLNLFGVRAATQEDDSFNDWIGVFWMNWADSGWDFRVWAGTTDPGAESLRHPERFSVKGTAILVPGQYFSSHRIGLHRKSYTALVQNGPLRVYRDSDKDTVLDMMPETIEESDEYGINIHRANPLTTSHLVQNWSAGCQVIANPSDFAELMELCESARAIWGPTFSYTLLTEEQL